MALDWLAPVTSLLGSVFQIGAAARESSSLNTTGAAQASTLHYNAKLTAAAREYNAKLAEQEAGFTLDTSKLDAELYRQAASKIVSQQRARYGASGVAVDSGSPLVVAMDALAAGEDAAQRELYGGKVRAWQARSGATSQRYSAARALQAADAEANLVQAASKTKARTALETGIAKPLLLLGEDVLSRPERWSRLGSELLS